ncbi:MAG: hypothetical protein RIR51_1481 [Bacteroidota bacterium]|jgi:phosphopantothenoylcysteine decarboxylase/phosphopantothenate--cysteine ligase
MSLKGKKIILGISASIAAYKSIFLLRLLEKQGAEVRVIQTNASKDFVSPLVLSTFSRNPVWIDFHQNNVWNNHVELGLWGDAMVVAPASCNTLAKMVNGICDNILIATYLSARCPIFISPAMDEDMYKHPSTKENIKKLESYGNYILPVGKGALASGLDGEGRMAEPEQILSTLEEYFSSSTEFKGKKILISAGPTRELIDPVRYISNFSTGKMGIALAEQAKRMGAKVVLVLGPTENLPQLELDKLIRVNSASEMKEACDKEFEEADITIMAAAVADYASVQSKNKIKKAQDEWILEMKKNPDILKGMGERKKAGQLLFGFALETDSEEENALKKLKAKNLDGIFLNSLNTKGAGFATNTNEINAYFSNGERTLFSLKSKDEISKEILLSILNSSTNISSN